MKPLIVALTLFLAPLSILSSQTKALQKSDQVALIKQVKAIPKEIRLMIAEYYLTRLCYKKVYSISGSALVYIRKQFQEKTTNLFLESTSDAENHYRPTKHKHNPFILEPQEDGTPQLAYIHQEQAHRNPTFRDNTKQNNLNINKLSSRPPTILVGPTSERRYFHAGMDLWQGGGEQKIFVRKAFYDPNDFEVSHMTHFRHSFKADQGATMGAHHWNRQFDWWLTPDLKAYQDGVDWKDYEMDLVTSVAVNADIDVFYSATQSGKLFRYGRHSDPEYGYKFFWWAEPFPVNIGAPIQDIETSYDGRYLWVLSFNRIYSYRVDTPVLKDNKLCLHLSLPIPAQENNDDMLSLIRTTPYQNILLAGTKNGSVYLINIRKKQCYPLMHDDEQSAVEEMWLSKENKLVLLHRSGKLRFCYLSLVDPYLCFTMEKEQ